MLLVCGQISSEPLTALGTGIGFSRSLVLEDLDSQRQLLAFCEGTPPALAIQRRGCWPSEFKQWLQLRGWCGRPERWRKAMKSHEKR